MKKTGIYLLGLFVTVTLLSACQSTENNESNVKDVQDVKDDNNADIKPNTDSLFRFDELFTNVPSPYVMSRMLESSGIISSPGLLHQPDMVSQYSSERSKALNMGIYAADLTYSHVTDLFSNEIEYVNLLLNIGVNFL